MGDEHALTASMRRLRSYGQAAILCLPLIVVATLPHEIGHWAAARAFGLQAEIRSSSTRYLSSGPGFDRQRRRAFFIAGMGGTGPLTLHEECRRFRREWIIMTASGPAVNLLASALGLVWLARLRRRWAEVRHPAVQAGIATLLSLSFAKTATSAFTALLPFFPRRGDAHRLSVLLPIPQAVVAIAVVVSALAVGVATIRLQPPGRRLPLLVGGAAGAAVGAVVWLRWLGPLLLGR